jgi:hypothetical protein
MNVTFHALAAAGIAHIAATRLETARDVRFCRSDWWVVGAAICLAVLSHGVLDGLKHGYPLRSTPDVLLAALIAIGWCLCVRRRFFPLFAGVFLASFTPDIVDLGPRMLRSATGISMPMVDATPIFPWHWPDGSGSMYPISSRAPDQTRILDAGQNTLVSWTNHLVIVAFAASGLSMNPRIFRFFSRAGS